MSNSPGRNTSFGGFPSCCGLWRALYVRMTELTYVTARTVGIVFLMFYRPTYCKHQRTFCGICPL